MKYDQQRPRTQTMSTIPTTPNIQRAPTAISVVKIRRPPSSIQKPHVDNVIHVNAGMQRKKTNINLTSNIAQSLGAWPNKSNEQTSRNRGHRRHRSLSPDQQKNRKQETQSALSLINNRNLARATPLDSTTIISIHDSFQSAQSGTVEKKENSIPQQSNYHRKPFKKSNIQNMKSNKNCWLRMPMRLRLLLIGGTILALFVIGLTSGLIISSKLSSTDTLTTVTTTTMTTVTTTTTTSVTTTTTTSTSSTSSTTTTTTSTSTTTSSTSTSSSTTTTSTSTSTTSTSTTSTSTTTTSTSTTTSSTSTTSSTTTTSTSVTTTTTTSTTSTTATTTTATTTTTTSTTTTKDPYACGNMTTFAYYDIPNNNLATSSSLANYTACCAWCLSYTGCVGLTWGLPTAGWFRANYCFLKSAFPSVSSDSALVSAHI